MYCIFSEDLDTLLSVDERPADVIAVGFQELDLSAETLILNADSNKEQVLVYKYNVSLF